MWLAGAAVSLFGLVSIGWSATFPPIGLAKVGAGFVSPVQLTNAGDGTRRIFVLEQTGRIRLMSNGLPAATPFLDLSGKVICCGEQGLLSAAFPPGFAQKKYFYASYTDLAGLITVSRFRISANPDVADPASEQVLLKVPHPFGNHNAGQLAFSPKDGYLYIGMGDGGSGGDPFGNGQNPAALLGKLLRIDVEGGTFPYGIPPTNPFRGAAGYAPEIWALGMRNPWRFSFDRQTSDLYIADVGQELIEEIDYQPNSSLGGENYGWNVMEGPDCYAGSNCAARPDLVRPVSWYHHDEGCAVIGGFVYHGAAYPQLDGLYLYADYCSGALWGLKRDLASWQSFKYFVSGFNFTSFGEDEAGEVYVTAADGSVYQVQAATLAQISSPAPGSTLAGTATFTWSASPQANAYWLDVGNSLGIGDISAGSQTDTSRTVANLPCDGRTLYVRLWTRIFNVWQTPFDYTYTACTAALARIASPAPGSVLVSTNTTFTWNVSPPADAYWLDVGNSLGQGDISAGSQTQTSRLVTNLPCDGRTLYVRLWTHISGIWQTPFDYTYAACTATLARIASPTPGSTLPSTSVTFTWNASSVPDAYWLDVGNALGQGDISAGLQTLTSRTVSNLPCDSRTLYVRLWTRIANAWQTPFDYTYKACPGP